MSLLKVRLQLLLVALVFLIVVYPLIQGAIILNVMLTAVLLAALYSVSEKRRQRFVALLLGIPYFIALWFYQLGTDHVAVAVLSPAFGILFLGYVTQVLIRHVIRATRVDTQMIYGAIAGYLMLGLIWAMLYTLIETVQPGSFSLSASVGETRTWNDLLYFSYVTLTTLGYGDVVPISSRVRSLAILEAVTGVFYVAVLVARLVGLHIIHERK
jgi:hypothetical protein